MIEVDVARLAVGIVGAAALTWLVTSTTLLLFGVRTCWAALTRGLGLALLSLVMLVTLRLFAPDTLILPVVFLFICAGSLLYRKKSPLTNERLAVSIVASMAAVGAIALADGLLRFSGSRLSLGL